MEDQIVCLNEGFLRTVMLYTAKDFIQRDPRSFNTVGLGSL